MTPSERCIIHRLRASFTRNEQYQKLKLLLREYPARVCLKGGQTETFHAYAVLRQCQIGDLQVCQTQTHRFQDDIVKFRDISRWKLTGTCGKTSFAKPLCLLPVLERRYTMSNNQPSQWVEISEEMGGPQLEVHLTDPLLPPFLWCLEGLYGNPSKVEMFFSRKHGEGFFRWVHLSCSHESHCKG